MNLWLDDVRNPAAFGRLGYKWVKTVSGAKLYFEHGEVEHCSLDHDLGACDACMKLNGFENGEAWLASTDGQSMPHCEHVGTGYDLVCWLEETGLWPRIKPQVHSANPVGRARMQRVIDMHYNQEGA